MRSSGLCLDLAFQGSRSIDNLAIPSTNAHNQSQQGIQEFSMHLSLNMLDHQIVEKILQKIIKIH